MRIRVVEAPASAEHVERTTIVEVSREIFRDQLSVDAERFIPLLLDSLGNRFVGGAGVVDNRRAEVAGLLAGLGQVFLPTGFGVIEVGVDALPG